MALTLKTQQTEKNSRLKTAKDSELGEGGGGGITQNIRQ